ncbi:MAG: copper resistance protein NlpE [Methylobacter sp.]|nr:copper resistance protein NlpE [Methylobacter sp.]
MRTFRQQFKRILTFFLFGAIFSGYNPVFAETAETKDKDTHHAPNSLDWPGIYYGFTPCADCNGIKTTLALNKNNSYILITQYVGKSEREFVEKGKFTSDNKSNTIVLTPRNSSTTQQYFVGENRLIQLDNNGNRISGKLAERYILRRTDIVQSSPSH